MVKPITEFGGWLKFFQVTHIIGVIAIVITILLMIIAVFVDVNYKEAIEFAVYTIDLLVALYFTIKILNIVKDEDSEWTNADSTTVRGSIQTVIHFLIWRSYFRKSKRVALYYS